jgi:serine/threonine protein kinase
MDPLTLGAASFDRPLPALVHSEDFLTQSLAKPGPIIACHRDVNPKNVLLTPRGAPAILDWDSAGSHSARHEVAAVALTWAGIEVGEPDSRIVADVLAGYNDRDGIAGHLASSDAAGWVMPWLRFTEFNIARLFGRRGTIDAGESELAHQRLKLGLAQILRFSDAADRWGATLQNPPTASHIE